MRYTKDFLVFVCNKCFMISLQKSDFLGFTRYFKGRFTPLYYLMLLLLQLL